MKNEDKGKKTGIIDKVETALIITGCIVIVVTFFFIKPFQVSGESMDTTFHDGQRVLVNKLAYKEKLPEKGDVIVFKKDGQFLIKRVIALPGDTVEIQASKTIVNGKEISEPYITKWEDYTMAEQTVPGDMIYVMGDNRDESFDSRAFGPVSMKQVTGRVMEHQRTAPESY